jgi:hypothetical protein
MKFVHFFKAAAALLVVAGLGGCFDLDMEVEIVGADKALGRVLTTLPKDFVDLADLQSGNSDFCGEGSEILETDEAYTCMETYEGDFATLFPADKDDETVPTIEIVGPGLARISFPTADMRANLAGSSGNDADAIAMMAPMFEGHTITLRVIGRKILDTNMVKAADGRSAELSIPLMGLLTGEIEIPDEAYAVVQIP